jgi:DNA-binding XRE family transcriptional regulator
MRPGLHYDKLKPKELLIELGTSIKRARMLRMITLVKLAEETGLHRGTLLSIEKGSPTVAIGSYLDVMYHLGFHHKMNDLVKLTRYFG